MPNTTCLVKTWMEPKFAFYYELIYKQLMIIDNIICNIRSITKDVFIQLSVDDTLLTFICCLLIAISILIIYFRKVEKNTRTLNILHSDLNIFDLAKMSYKNDNAEMVINLLTQFHFDINSVAPETGLNLLLCACLGGNIKLIKFILEHGGNLKSSTNDGDTALYLAVFSICNSSANLEIIDVLIKAGCEVNAFNYRGYTALHQAACKGNIDAIRKLLSYGANPRIANNFGIYPVNMASTNGFLKAASLLEISDEDDNNTPENNSQQKKMTNAIMENFGNKTEYCS